MNVVRHVRAHASLVVLFVLAAVAFGALSLGSLPSGIYPEVDFPRLVAVARSGDLPPEVLEVELARPMEGALAAVPGVRRLRTRIIRGAVEINVQMQPGGDMDIALQRAESRLAEVKLPAGAELQVERVMPTALPVVSFNLQGADPRTLRDLASYVVAPALTRVAGVGVVDVQGGDVREIEIVLDPARLAAAHLLPSAVADKVAAAQVVSAVGRTHELRQVLTALVSAPATIEALRSIPVAMGPEGPIPLRAVAEVFEGAQDRTVSISGPTGDVVLVAVSRALGASTPRVVEGARAAVAALRLPAGVKIVTVYDQSILIDDAMHGVRDAILLGIALSFLVLALFLRDLRAGVAAAAAVPLTLVATFGAMRLFGQTLNLMSLGGLAVAIGLVVDDAIVVVEAIVRRVEEGMEVREAAERGTEDLFAAVVGTTFTTVVVFAPLGLLSGVVGSFFGALAITLCAAVLLSLIFAVTVVPLLAGLLLRPRRRTAAGPGRMARGYGGVVRRAVHHPVISVALLVLLGGGGWLASRSVASGFLPTMDEGAFVLDFFLPPGTSLEETDRQARKLDHILSTTRGIEGYTRRTGAEMGPATATQQNTGDIIVRLVPRSRRAPLDDIIEEVRGRVAEEVPEARTEFVQVLQDMLDDLSGNPRPIEVRLFGDDHRVLEDKARAVAARLEGVPDLVDLFNGVEGVVPAFAAVVDPAAGARLGVTAGMLASDLEVALAGRVAGALRSGDRSVGLRVRMPDEVRFDPQRLATLPLAYGTGGAVPLNAVASLGRPAGPAVLSRENQRPVVIVDAAIRGGDLGGVARSVSERLQGFPLDPGYQLEVGGQAEGARRTQLDLARVFGLGVVLILGILILQLRSLRMALVVLLGAPLALVGAVITLLATGLPLNASSLMGCVLLAGLVVKNGILLLEHAEKELDAGASVEDALVAAGERRLRPILMTTAATIAGLLPLAFAWGAGSELQRPLAVATIGGLVLSTAVTLFAVPALAAALNPRRRRARPDA